MKTKNLIAKLILIVMVALSVLAIYSNRKVKAASAYTDSAGNTWYYDRVAGTAYGYGDNTTVAANVIVDIGTNYSRTSLTVPDNLGGYPVVSIGSWDNTNTSAVTTGTAGFIRASTSSAYTSSTSTSTLPDYLRNNSSYWRSYYPKITSITLPDTVAQINNYAFYGTGSGQLKSYSSTRTYRYGSYVYNYSVYYYTYGLPNLQTINFPKRLREIGNYAFSNSKINNVSFDSKTALTTIGDYAFYRCSVGNLTIPRNVTTIGNYAFYNNPINSVLLADNCQLETIGDYAFANNNNLTRVTLCDNPKITTIGNYAFSKDVNSIGVQPLNQFDFTKLSELTTIGNNAFSKTSLTSVDLSNNTKLTTIGANAFSDTPSIEGTITIGENVTTVGNEAFYKTNISGVTFVESNNEVTVGAGAFANTKVTDITLTNRISSIGAEVFSNCTELTNVTINNDCIFTSIPNEAFENDPITSINIPSSITRIGQSAFKNTKLTSVTIPENVKTIDSHAFFGTQDLETVVINPGNNLTTISAYCFRNSGLKNITLPDNITTIGEYAFSGTKLTSFEIPNTITTMGINVFNNCQDLRTVTFENTTQLTQIPNNTFYDSGLESIVIPPEITSIGSYAFRGTKFTTFEIPASIATMGTGAFSYTENLESVTFEDNSALTVIPSSAFEHSNVSSIEIGDGVTEIQNNAFNASNIENLVIKGNVTKLGTGLFQNCDNLRRVEFTETSNLESIPDSLFSGSSVEEVVLPIGLKSIGNYAFENTNITSIDFPETLVSIGNYAFRGTKLEEVELPSATKTFGSYVFAGTKELTSFTFAEESELTSIPAGFLAGSGIEEITIPNYITSIGSSAFGSISMTSVSQTNPYGSGGTYYIYEGDGSALKRITIPASVTSIGSYAFAFTKDLESVTFDENTTITSIPTYCFAYSGITEFDIPASVTNIDSYAFEGSDIEDIFIPNTVTNIGSYAFRNTENAKSLVFQENTKVTIIPQYCFYNSGIESVEFAEGIRTIEQYSFCGCKRLHGDIVIPDSVQYLGYTSTSSYNEYPVFAGCESFDGDFYTGNGVTNILGGFMDENCTKLKRVILGSNVRNLYSSNSTSAYIDGSYVYNLAYINGAFPHLEHIYVNGDPSNVQFMTYWNCKKLEPANTTEYKVHRYYEYVAMTISTLPGVHIINADTNEEIESSTLKAGEYLNYKVQVDEAYADRYNYLKIIRSTMDGEGSTETVDFSTEVQQMLLVEDGMIGIINADPNPDLSLRTFISRINNVQINDRVPSQTMVDGDFSYLHTKKPYVVNSGDLINYTIRVYNEGSVDAHANKVNVFIPEGLELVQEHILNIDYRWTDEGNGKYSSDYLSDTIETTENEDGTVTRRVIEDKKIDNYYGEGSKKYRDIELTLKVVNPKEVDNKVLNIIAEIAEISAESSSNDPDSIPGSITEGVDGTYRHEEAEASDSTSYIAGVQDDDDFESVMLRKLIKADYQIRIGKVDEKTNMLLSGAKFNLLDSEYNIIDTQYTNDEGFIDFGEFTTYGTEDDVYFIEEAETPEGYIVEQKAKVKLMVHKRNINEDDGTCTTSMDYEISDYELSTENVKYIPITTEEEFKKIGSNEDVTVNGVTYQFKNNAYYQLLNDISLSTSENWNPLPKFRGVLEGNGHRISNLTYATKDLYTNISRIGLFDTLDGIIDNVVLDNVNIHVNIINTDVNTSEGYHSGIGSFAGYMIAGTIQNCTVNGYITASTDNVGGFVGHTAEGRISRFLNCTFNPIGEDPGISVSNINGTEEERDATEAELAEVSETEPTKTISVIDNKSGTTISTYVDYVTGKAQTTYDATASNIGGIVGCSLGSLEMKNCINNAMIKTTKYNGAGLVGYLNATDFQDFMKIYPKQEGSLIQLVLQNKRTSSLYELRLSSKDVQTLGLITGGVYQILDANKNVVEGQENVEITEESVKIADVDFDGNGADVYYIKELSAPDGYRALEGKIKVVITKYWNRERGRFMVNVKGIVLSDEEFEEDTAEADNTGIDSQTGIIFDVDYTFAEGVVGFVQDAESEAEIPLLKQKALIEGCANNGFIYGVENPMNVAGIIATSDSRITIKDCTNNAEINASASSNLANVAGIISRIDNWKNRDSKITNCTNNGKIVSNGSTISRTAGILTHGFTNVVLNNCVNTGNVETTGSNAILGGILAYGTGEISIKNSLNSGSINMVNPTNGEAAAGIFGEIDQNGYTNYCKNNEGNKNYEKLDDYSVTDSKVKIENCNNTGSISGVNHTGGIAGRMSGSIVEVSECHVNGTEDEKITVQSGYRIGDLGGIVSVSSADVTKIDNCSVDNAIVDGLNRGADIIVGGIIGNTSAEYTRDNIYSFAIQNVNCQNNNVTNSNINATSGNSYDTVTGGVIGYINRVNNANICNNKVDNCNITCAGENKNGGIVANVYQQHTSNSIINVNENQVLNTNFLNQNRGNTMTSIGGVMSSVSFYDQVCVNNNIVENITTSQGDGKCAGILADGGTSCKYYTLDNNKVKNISMSATGGSDSYAGMAGVFGSCDSYFTPEKIELNGNRVTNFNIDKVEYANYSNCFGGIAGFIKGYDFDVNDNYVSNLDFDLNIYNNGNGVGGIIGVIYDVPRNYSVQTPKTFNNNNARNFKLKYLTDSSSSNSNKSAGGLFGTIYIYKLLTIINSNVEDIDMETYATQTGGAVGNMYNNSSSNRSNFIKCSAKNINIVHYKSSTGSYSYGSGNENLSGFNAFGYGRITYQDIDVDNVRMKVYGQYSNIGGLAGWSDHVSTFSNIRVNNFKMNMADAAGVSSQSCIGGMLGGGSTNTGTAIIDNCKVNDIDIYGGNGNAQMGGLVGMNWGTMSVSNSELTNSNIHTVFNVYSSSNGSSNGVGGLIGPGQCSSSLFTNNKIENVNIYNTAGTCAGLAAGYYSERNTVDGLYYNNFKIHDARPNNSKSSYTANAYSSCTGMFIAYSSVRINNVTMKDVEIEAAHTNVSLMVSNVQSGGGEYNNINLENIIVRNEGTPDYNPSDAYGNNRQNTALLAANFSGSAPNVHGLEAKNIRIEVGKGHTALLGCNPDQNFACYDMNIEDVKIINKGTYIGYNSDTQNYEEIPCEDGGNCMGIIAATTPGADVALNNCTIKDVELKIARGYRAGLGTLVAKTGGCDVTLNNCTIDNIKLENYGDKTPGSSSGSDAPYAVTAGIISIGATVNVNGGEISNIDIKSGNNTEGNSKSIAAGILGLGHSAGINFNGAYIHDISVTNTNDDFTGGIAGLVCTSVNMYSSIIDKINVKAEINNSPDMPNPYVGGLFGGILGGDGITHNITGNTITNINTESDAGYSAGGLIGIIHPSYRNGTYGIVDTKIEGNTIENVSISNKAAFYSSTNDYTGGLIGADYTGRTIINNNTINNITTNNNSSCSTGGIYGFTTYATLTGNDISNIEVNHYGNAVGNNNPTYMNAGGLVGFATGAVTIGDGTYYEAVETVDDETGETVITNEERTRQATIDNVKLTDTFGGRVGGLVGFTAYKVEIKNAEISNVETDVNVPSIFNNGNDLGGLVGATTYLVDVQDTNITNNKIDSNISAYMGGIVGFDYSYTPPVVKNVNMKNIIVNQEVEPELQCRTPRAGGITSMHIGEYYDSELQGYAASYENITIEDILVNIKTYDENGNVVYKGESEVGGLVGLADFADAVKGFSEYTGDPVTLTPARERKLRVNNITIRNTSDTFEDGTKKGLYGIGHTGGILGFGQFELDNIEIDNVDMESYMNVGGAVGHTESPSIIKNFNISNSNINTLDLDLGAKYHTGGVIGFVGESTLIKDTTVDNVIINNAAYGNVGGIAGSTDKTNSEEIAVTMTNVTVKNCEKELENGSKVGITGKAHVGGFIGFGKPVVVYTEPEDYSTVENCYIAGTRQPDEYDRYGYLNTDVGGFAGNMIQSGYILGAKLIDCYIENNRLREKRFPDEPYNYTELTNNVGMFTGYNDDWRALNNIVNATSSNVTVKMNEQ